MSTEVLELNHSLSFAFIGGDLRQLRVIAALLSEGHRVRSFALDVSSVPDAEIASTLADCISDADIVVLPLPYSTIPKQIHTDMTVYTEDVLHLMHHGQILLAGCADEYLKGLADLYQVPLADYANREEFAVLNAIPTAEGALEIAMRETPHTIHESRCLVLGYGRIGKILADRLLAMGAKTDVFARKHRDLAWVHAHGLCGIRRQDFDRTLPQYDVIFNTVPAPILDFHALAKIRDDCCIIDLASKPGGVDFAAAREMGKTVIWALSLPGKVAPQTAGDIMKDTIMNILEEMGV